MRVPLTCSILLIASRLLCAQVAMPIQPPVPAFTELKTYLGLSDAQVQSLQSVQTSLMQAQQAINTQINEKYTSLNSLLNSGSAPAVQVGQLMLDIQALQKQLPVSSDPYKSQALAVLNDAQKAKLTALGQALQLDTAAWQAVSLLLLDSPAQTGRVVPLLGVTGATNVICGSFSSGPIPSPIGTNPGTPILPMPPVPGDGTTGISPAPLR